MEGGRDLKLGEEGGEEGNGKRKQDDAEGLKQSNPMFNEIFHSLAGACGQMEGSGEGACWEGRGKVGAALMRRRGGRRAGTRREAIPQALVFLFCKRLLELYFGLRVYFFLFLCLYQSKFMVISSVRTRVCCNCSDRPSVFQVVIFHMCVCVCVCVRVRARLCRYSKIVISVLLVRTSSPGPGVDGKEEVMRALWCWLRERARGARARVCVRVGGLGGREEGGKEEVMRALWRRVSGSGA